MFVLFRKALGSHGAIGHPPTHKEAKEDGNNAIDEEKPLPGLQRPRGDEREAVGEETADNLLGAVHHVPIDDSGGLLLSSIPDGGEDDEGGLADRFEETE